MSPAGRVALVTGGAGFIGSHLVAELLAKDWTVRCVVRPSSSLRWLDGLSIEPVTADVANANHATSLQKAVDGASAVFHLAGAPSAALEETHARVNIGGTRNVVEASRIAAPEARIIFCSSLAAAGPSDGKRSMNETDTPKPISVYGRSKLAAEKIIEDSGAPHVIVRPPPVYGPRDRGMLMLFRLVAMGIAPHLASRTQRLSMVYVSDLVLGLVSAAESDGEGVYYMTDGDVHTWEEIIAAIAKTVGRSPRFFAIPSGIAEAAARIERIRALVMGGKPLITPDRLLDLSQNEWTCDDTRARLDLDYSPEISLEAGMRSTCEWYRSNGWLARQAPDKPLDLPA